MPWDGPRSGNNYYDALFAFRREHWHRIVWWQIERKCALELDHRVPLWSVADLPAEERRAFFGPTNLWLLCPSHHLQKSVRETTERAAQKRFAKAQLTLI